MSARSAQVGPSTDNLERAVRASLAGAMIPTAENNSQIQDSRIERVKSLVYKFKKGSPFACQFSTTNGKISDKQNAARFNPVDQDKLVKYFHKNFHKRECKKFLLDNKKFQADKDKAKPGEAEPEQFCQCGHRFKSHSPEAIKFDYKEIDNQEDVRWNANTDTLSSSTDAFGELEFSNQSQTCKYIRVDHETDINKLVEMMKKVWKLEDTNLLISVTGGAKNFKLKPQLKEVFRRGLIKAADSTGAWIITGGTNAGVMKHVGEAIRDSAITRGGSKTPIVAIGIATWGCINNRESLTHENGMWPANYKPLESETDKAVSVLDPNHTHFILVDNGSRNKFGVEIPLRGKLERMISKPNTKNRKSDEVAVPVVCVVLEGGPNTLETVKSAIENETPVIVVEGSGRVADILAYAYRHWLADDLMKFKGFEIKSGNSVWSTVERMIKENFPTLADVQKHVELVRYCVKRQDYMTVFSLNDSSGSIVDIDVVMLKALLKVNRDRSFDQLRLALAWNRVDVAKEDILTDDLDFKPQELHDLMYTAIVNNRVDFVKLFLEKGLILDDFLTNQRRIQLYNEPITKERCPMLQRYANKETGAISLKNVGEMMKMLINDMYRPMYCHRQYSSIKPEQYLKTSEHESKWRSIRKNEEDRQLVHNALYKLDDPAKELFLWSILVHMKEMSVVFWRETKDDMALALNAQMMLSKMLEKEKDSEIGQILEQQSTFYENLAVDVLRECYKTDQRKATLSLVRNLPNFGDMTVLSFAVEAPNLTFVSHQACQSLLTMLWMGKLADDNSSWKIFGFLFVPFLAPLLLTYRQDEHMMIKSSSTASVHNQNGVIDAERSISHHVSEDTLTQPDGRYSDQSTKVRNAGCGCCKRVSSVGDYLQNLLFFFRAPIIRFAYYCIFYFGFILLYGIILLTDFRATIGPMEIALIIWISSMLLEEIREVLAEDGDTMRKKLHNYFADIWNILDVIAIGTYYVGLILRCIPYSICNECLYAARIILALNLMCFFFRILHMFSVHRELGPKLVMIGRMMRDLLYFMIVLLVFVAAYGISSQVILYPNQPLNIELAKSVISPAWWSLFGDINLQEVSGESCPPNDSTKPYTAKQCAELGYDTTNVTCWGKTELCPAIDWFVPILLAIYCLICNVMMLNLLIAMFSNTFNSVQDNTTVLWKMQRYHLVKEYCTRPALPPPLIIISHIIIIIRLIRNKCFSCCTTRPALTEASKFEFKMKFTGTVARELRMWEHVNAEEYMRGNEAKQRKTLENIVKETNKRVEQLGGKVNELSESKSSLSSVSSQSELEQRMTHLEEQLKQTTAALEQVLAALTGSTSGNSEA